MSLQVDIHKKLGAFTLDVALEASVEKPEVLGLLGALVGWGLLPDMVTIRPPTAANHHYVPKGQGLLLNLAMTEIFAALFWRWPREWVYLAGSLIGLLFTFALLYNNLV